MLDFILSVEYSVFSWSQQWGSKAKEQVVLAPRGGN